MVLKSTKLTSDDILWCHDFCLFNFPLSFHHTQHGSPVDEYFEGIENDDNESPASLSCIINEGKHLKITLL